MTHYCEEDYFKVWHGRTLFKDLQHNTFQKWDSFQRFDRERLCKEGEKLDEGEELSVKDSSALIIITSLLLSEEICVSQTRERKKNWENFFY